MKISLKILSIVFLFINLSQNTLAQKKVDVVFSKNIRTETLQARRNYKKFFDKGVEFLNTGEFDSAISYLSSAISQYEHPDAYYNRGVANLRNGSRVGFCKDMREARRLGDFDADSLYCLKCIKKDTIYYDLIGNISNAENSFKYVCREVALFDTSIVSKTFTRDKDGLYTLGIYYAFSAKCKNLSTKLPSFPGGIKGIRNTDVLKMAPPGIMNDYDILKSYCSFRISPEGDVFDVQYLGGSDRYNNITKNRLLRMGKWEPATLNGKYEDVILTIDVESNSKIIYFNLKDIEQKK